MAFLSGQGPKGLENFDGGLPVTKQSPSVFGEPQIPEDRNEFCVSESTPLKEEERKEPQLEPQPTFPTYTGYFNQPQAFDTRLRAAPALQPQHAHLYQPPPLSPYAPVVINMQPLHHAEVAQQHVCLSVDQLTNKVEQLQESIRLSNAAQMEFHRDMSAKLEGLKPLTALLIKFNQLCDAVKMIRNFFRGLN